MTNNHWWKDRCPSSRNLSNRAAWIGLLKFKATHQRSNQGGHHARGQGSTHTVARTRGKGKDALAVAARYRITATVVAIIMIVVGGSLFPFLFVVGLALRPSFWQKVVGPGKIHFGMMNPVQGKHDAGLLRQGNFPASIVVHHVDGKGSVQSSSCNGSWWIVATSLPEAGIDKG